MVKFYSIDHKIQIKIRQGTRLFYSLTYATNKRETLNNITKIERYNFSWKYNYFIEFLKITTKEASFRLERCTWNNIVKIVTYSSRYNFSRKHNYFIEFLKIPTKESSFRLERRTRNNVIKISLIVRSPHLETQVRFRAQFIISRSTTFKKHEKPQAPIHRLARWDALVLKTTSRNV